MTYRQFLTNHINPYLTDDRGENNFSFSCTKDSLHRDGLITDKQAQNWSQPDTLEFHSKIELDRIKKSKTPRANKYVYLFVLQGSYGFGYEDLTQSESYKEVKTDLEAYRENEGGNYRIIKRRELK